MRRLPVLLAVVAAAALVAASSASAARIYVVNDAAGLSWFDSDAPGTSLGNVAITGVGAGETVAGLDWRPADGTLLLVTVSGSTGRLYVLDPSTGVASAPKTLAADPTDGSSPYTGLDPAVLGVDVNPVPDRLRIVASSGQNLRVNPANGLTTTDGTINPANPNVSAVAYVNPDADPTTGTNLFDYGYSTDHLYRQNPPNNGTLEDVGASGLSTQVSGSYIQMDVAPDGTAFLTAIVDSQQALFRQNLVTGAATPLGQTTTSFVRGMTALNNVVSIADATVSVAESAGAAEVTLTRAEPFDSAFVRAAVPVTVTAGSAGGDDFGAAPATATFAAGASTATISVPLTDDAADEGAETFTVTIGPGANTTAVAPRTATVTIADDDPAQVTTPTTNEVVREVVVPGGPAPVVLLAGRCANARTGTSDDDALAGTAAGDRLSGGLGADGLSGGPGDDCLNGGAGDDLLAGNAGRDDLRGDGGNDVLRGGSGGDRLRGGGGSNRISGGGGADAVNAANRRRDVVDCGPGRDSAMVDRADRVRGCERVRRRR